MSPYEKLSVIQPHMSPRQGRNSKTAKVKSAGKKDQLSVISINGDNSTHNREK